MKHELTEKKAAVLLGVTVGRVSQLVNEKLLDAIKVNGSVRISRESVDVYLEESRKPGRPPRTSYATASRHTLMNGPYPVAEVVYDSALEEPLSVVAVLDAARAPLGVMTSGSRAKRRELNDWWRHRSIPNSRQGIEAKLLSLGAGSAEELPIRSMGLSLSDCYWLKPADANELKWPEVNFFDNPFVQAAPGGWDDWLSGVGLGSPDNTSEGELPKKWVIDEAGRRLLLKGCRTDDQRPCNEVVATALHRRLLSPDDYVAYGMAETRDGIACECANFLSSEEEFIPAAYVKELGGRLRATSAYDRFCRTVVSLGVAEGEVRTALAKMTVCDIILANSDRHWRNFGLVRNIDSLGLRMAPIFDSGNSLWFSKPDAQVAVGDHSFILRPFARDAEGALAFVDDLSWFDPASLDGFVDEACDILASSKYATAKGRLDYIREGLAENVTLVCNAARILKPRIARGAH